MGIVIRLLGRLLLRPVPVPIPVRIQPEHRNR